MIVLDKDVERVIKEINNKTPKVLDDNRFYNLGFDNNRNEYYFYYLSDQIIINKDGTQEVMKPDISKEFENGWILYSPSYEDLYKKLDKYFKEVKRKIIESNNLSNIFYPFFPFPEVDVELIDNVLVPDTVRVLSNKTDKYVLITLMDLKTQKFVKKFYQSLIKNKKLTLKLRGN
jgi:hypothetical protein